MKQVIERIKANDRLPVILKELSNVASSEIECAPQAINDTEINQAGIWISAKLGKNRIDSTIVTGGLLYFYSCATDSDDRRTLFDNLIDDISVSRSQAYRCIAVWERFGKLLIDEPILKDYFVVESLKMLAEPDAGQLAREAAIEMARGRQRVRIADAQRLVAEFALPIESFKETAPPKPKKSGKPSRARPARRPTSKIWEYAGKFIRFVLEPADVKPKSKIDHEAIIRDLEAALELYRNEFAKTKAVNRETKSPSAEVSHV